MPTCLCMGNGEKQPVSRHCQHWHSISMLAERIKSKWRGAGSGSGPLDMVSRGSGTETRPHSARLYGRTGTTGFYNFRSCGQSFPLEKSDFF